MLGKFIIEVPQKNGLWTNSFIVKQYKQILGFCGTSTNMLISLSQSLKFAQKLKKKDFEIPLTRKICYTILMIIENFSNYWELIIKQPGVIFESVLC